MTHRFQKSSIFFKSSATWVKSFRNLLVWIENSCNARNTGVENVNIFLKPSATCATHVSEILFEFICLATHATQVSRIFNFFKHSATCATMNLEIFFELKAFATHDTQVSEIFRKFSSLRWHYERRTQPPKLCRTLATHATQDLEILLFEYKSFATNATLVL